jgi:flagellar motor switch protein FliM
VKVYLGDAELSLGEVMHLELGDIIPLDTAVQQDLVMQIASIRLFNVQIGKSGNHLAVQVKSVIRQTDQVE